MEGKWEGSLSEDIVSAIILSLMVGITRMWDGNRDENDSLLCAHFYGLTRERTS